MRKPFPAVSRPPGRPAILALSALLAVASGPAGSGQSAARQVHEAPAGAPSSGRVAPAGEPGEPLHVRGVVVDGNGTPVRGASLYVYQTDHEGYYGVKPESDNRRPRLKLFLRTDAAGQWQFDTVRPGAYPGGQVPAHIHFEVAAEGHAPRIFEIVFAGDPLITDRMRQDDAFSVRPVTAGRVTERIVLR